MAEINFLYKQIGLNNNQIKNAVKDLSFRVLNELHGYSDNHPVAIPIDSIEEIAFASAAELLKSQNIILYKYRDDDAFRGYAIVVINRYMLELLSAELNWLDIPEEKEGTAPFACNLAYYDLKTGKLIINGIHKNLRKPNKALFDALFIASPNYVDREKLLSIIGARKKDKASKITINEAFTNLRKICGVSKYVISLNAKGGRLYNIETHPLSAQKPPSRFLTDINPK